MYISNAQSQEITALELLAAMEKAKETGNRISEINLESTGSLAFKLMATSFSANLLEISPFVNPTFESETVKYFDVINHEEMFERVLELKDPFYMDKMEANKDIYIDFVEPTGDLSIIDQKFDTIFSSHGLVSHIFCGHSSPTIKF